MHYYVPLGLEKEFPRRYLDVTGMDWYTKDALDDLTIYFLPANHRSGRSLYEMNQTLCNTLLIKCDLKISNSASSKWEKQLKFRTTDVS
jgi:L-ascorbate metabolism protein UlaG (beta-lactamase superfamily)